MRCGESYVDECIVMFGGVTDTLVMSCNDNYDHHMLQQLVYNKVTMYYQQPYCTCSSHYCTGCHLHVYEEINQPHYGQL